MLTLRPSVELLRTIPLFESLTDDDLKRIIDSPENCIEEFTPLQPIIDEGEIGDCMYIILEGTVDVRIKAVGGREITIATLKTGEYFGEQALLPGATGKRNASVRSLQSSRLFKIAKKDVALGINEVDDLSVAFDVLQDADESVRMLIRSSRLFRSLSSKNLNETDLWTEVVEVGSGEIVVRESEQGDYMFIVLEGSVEVFVVDGDGQIVVLAELTRGQYFGEQALLPDGSGIRNANVRTKENSSLVRIENKYFQLILSHDNKLMFALRAVGEAQRKKIADAIGRSAE